MNNKLSLLTLIFIQFLTALFILMFLKVPAVSAACLVSHGDNLKYFYNGSTIRITNADNLVLDSMASYVRASLTVTLSGCSTDKQQDIWMSYWDGYTNKWLNTDDTGWVTATNSTSQYYDFKINNFTYPSNILLWSVGYNAASCDSQCYTGDDKFIEFYTIHQNSNQVSAEYGELSASFTEPWYTDTLEPAYSLLIGTDPAVTTNRDSANIPQGSVEVQIPPNYIFASNQHSSTSTDHGFRITFNISNYPIGNLQKNTTYYWRLKQGSNAAVGYMPGNTAGFVYSPPPPTVTTTTPAVSYGSVTLGGNVNPYHAKQLTYWFRYSTTQPASCNDTFGQSTAKKTSGVDARSADSFPISDEAADLIPDTTYYYCAIADNGFGLGYGNIIEFKTSVSRTDDGSKEADFYIDFADDWAQKVIYAPPTGLFKLWVYGKRYDDYQPGDTTTITVNNDPDKKISFNPIDKFGTDYSWQSFDIPSDWLQDGNDTFEFLDVGPYGSWAYNNLSIGVDTNSYGNSSGCFSDGRTKRCLDGTGGFPKGELMVYLQRVKAPTVSCSADSQTAGINQNVTWSAAINGGLPPFTYSWELSPAFSCVTPSTNCTGSASPTVSYSNTGPKSAILTVTDSNNITSPRVSCTSLTINEPLPPTGGGGSSGGGSTVTTCGAEGLKILEGLLTSPPNQGQTVSPQTTTDPLTKCIIDPKAAFAPFKIPTFEDLKSLYFDQSGSGRKTTLPNSPNHGTLTSALAPEDPDRIFYIDGSLTLDQSPFSGRARNAPVVVFIKNNLNINSNITYAASDAGAGLILVAGGDVAIDPSVTNVNAVIIAEGKILTGANTDASCSTSSVSASALVINGSLISLNPANPAIFCRKLADNSVPAEVINHQVKYLVILRDLLSDTYQKWSEIP